MEDWTQYFEYINFEPTPVQISQMRKSLEDILWLSPSDSSVKIRIKRTKALFQVHCHVASTSGHFTSKGVSEHFLPAIQIMEAGILREVNRWKKNRKLYEETALAQRVS